MKSKIIGMMLAFALALAACFGLGADRASAHQFDNNSYWACSATRTAPTDHVIHSHPILLAPGVVTYRCTAETANGVTCVRWSATIWWDLPGDPIAGHDYVRTTPSNC
jgi:hypothetical protein